MTFSSPAFRLLAASIVLTTTTTSAWAADQVKPALQAGGARQVALQNADGGWFFEVGDPDCGQGPGVSCPNTFGITGQGLLDAYQRTKDSSFLTAAIATGDALALRFIPGDGNPGTNADRPYSADVAFLVALAKASKNKSYSDLAEAWYGNVMLDYPDPVDRADNRLSRGAPNETLRGWDAAADIRAASDTGNKAYAAAMAARVLAQSVLWDFADPLLGVGFENFYRMLSRGSLLWALGDLNKKEFKSTETAYRDYLLALQEPGGSWGVGDTQNTAYIVIGLINGEKSKVKGEPLDNAIDGGAAFLLSMQAAAGTGGFAPFDGADLVSSGQQENTEVNSEALSALAAVHGKINP